MPQPDPRWDRLKDLFAAAAPIPAGERESFLKERGVGDATVAEVLALLGAHEPVDEQPGDTIGPYKLLENLGEGGFGTVWMAEQRSPVQRRVALKVLKAGMDSAQVLARFEQERQALALMQHPNIAQVYDAGTTKHGRPFFVMELVKGIPITDYASRERLTIQQRLELFVQVCRAVQHAHHKGVVHRDIKPRNVLVATADGRPLAKVIDFGIAKAVTGRLTERTLFTEHRAMVGTLEYMSPEQAEGLLDVDTRADVYSLGALLYELLTGSTPFVAAKLLEAGFGEMLRTLREVEPERPSVRVSSKAGAGWAASGALGGRDPKQLFGSLRGDLDWVVMKALEKDRGRRYGTADGLAADLERYLAGEAVEAVPPSLGYRVRKFVRRNRGVVVSASVVVAVAIIALLFVTAAQRESAQRLARMEELSAHALEQFRRATGTPGLSVVATKDETGRPIHENDRPFYKALALVDGLGEHSRRAAWNNQVNTYTNRLITAIALGDGVSYLSAKAELERCPVDQRAWEWAYADVRVEEAARRILSPPPISWCTAKGGRYIVCLPQGTSRIDVFDSREFKRVAVHPLPYPNPTGVSLVGEAACVAGHQADLKEWRLRVNLGTGAMQELDPADALFPTANGTYLTVREDMFRLNDAERGTMVREFRVEREAGSEVQVFPMGNWVLVERAKSKTEIQDGNFRQTIEPGILVDLSSPLRRIPVPSAAWINPAGPTHLGKGWLFDEKTGMVQLAPWADRVVATLAYPSEHHALVELQGTGWTVVDLRTGEPVSPTLPITFLDGDIFQAGPPNSHRCFHGFMELSPLSLETGEWLGPEPGKPDMNAEVTADGLRWIVNRESGIEVTTARPPQLTQPAEREPVLALTAVPHHAAVGIRGTTRNQDVLFVPDTGVPHRRAHPVPVLHAATSGNGKVQLRRIEGDKLVLVNSTGTVEMLSSVSAIGIRTMVLDHVGANMAVIAGDRLMHLPLTANEAPSDLGRLPMGSTTPPIAISGKTVALGQDDGFVQVLTGAHGPVKTTWRSAEAPVTHLAWSPDGTKLFIGNADGSCSLLLAQDLSHVAKLEGHLAAIRGSAWSPDSRRVFTCSLDGTVRCWPTDAPSHGHVLTPLLTLTEPEIAGRPTTLLTTPDGERLACGYDDGSIRVWDSVPWSKRLDHVPPLFQSSRK